tara:strand:+ start:673 stop:810 length:138 start_codon:yes stop_codon:yes gene_type:complete
VYEVDEEVKAGEMAGTGFVECGVYVTYRELKACSYLEEHCRQTWR